MIDIVGNNIVQNIQKIILNLNLNSSSLIFIMKRFKCAKFDNTTPIMISTNKNPRVTQIDLLSYIKGLSFKAIYNRIEPKIMQILSSKISAGIRVYGMFFFVPSFFSINIMCIGKIIHVATGLIVRPKQ